MVASAASVPPRGYLSVVIPAFNEEQRLPGTLAGWQTFLERQPYDWELLVVDDGSTDRTAQVALAGGARVLQLPVNLGKGAAVKTGMLDAGGRWLAYVDADLNVSPEHIPEALRLLEGGADVVVGRRSLAQYGRAEGALRLVAGGLVQVTRRTLVLRAIRDTQCGFKVFRREVGRAIFQRSLIRSFAFDIEVLFLAREKLGAYVVEMPVRTDYRAGSTFDPGRHLGAFLADIARIRLNDLAGRYSPSHP